jgi:hypothetical protein
MADLRLAAAAARARFVAPCGRKHVHHLVGVAAVAEKTGRETSKATTVTR